MPITETTGLLGDGELAATATKPVTAGSFRIDMVADIELGITSLVEVVQAKRPKRTIHAEATRLRTEREPAVLEGGAHVVR